MDNRPVTFPEWKRVLAQAPLIEAERETFRREILNFLHHCKVSRRAATASEMKDYLEAREGPAGGPAREALRWFYRAGRGLPALRRMPAVTGKGAVTKVALVPVVPPERRPSVPPRAAEDLGGADWERDLIKAARERGFLWRTEQTYREWAARFARFIAPRTEKGVREGCGR